MKFACDVTVGEWFECANHDPLPVLLGAGTSGVSGSVVSPSRSHLSLSAVGSSDLEILYIFCQEYLDRLYRASQTFRHLHEHLHGCKLMQTPGITEFGYYIFERRQEFFARWLLRVCAETVLSVDLLLAVCVYCEEDVKNRRVE